MSDEILLKDDPAHYWEMMFKKLARENSKLMERCEELEEKVNLLVDSINRQRLECCEQGKNLNEANYRLWEAVKPMLQEGIKRIRSKKTKGGAGMNDNKVEIDRLRDLLRWRDAEKEPPESLQKCLLLDPDAGAVEVAYWHGDFFSYRGLFNWKYWRPIGPLPGEGGE